MAKSSVDTDDRPNIYGVNFLGAYGEMVSHIHGMDGAGVRFSLGPH